MEGRVARKTSEPVTFSTFLALTHKLWSLDKKENHKFFQENLITIQNTIYSRSPGQSEQRDNLRQCSIRTDFSSRTRNTQQ
jgi:hypothetical protein